MVINNVTIGDIIINEIKKEIKEKGYHFSTYDVFKILDNYLYQKEILQLLNISYSSYYKYKKEKKSKYVDRKLYSLYLLLTNDSFKEVFEKSKTIYLEWWKNVWHLHNLSVTA